jgi:acetolactate synthase I/II/III large subunit
MPSVADVLARTAVGLGITHAFGLLGEGNLELVCSLRSRGVSWVAMRREDGVVCAADGFSQGSGRLGLGLVTHGPALVNALNPLVGAARGGTPLLLLCGELGPDDRDHPQWLDQAALVRAAGLSYRSVRDPGQAEATLRAAARSATARKRPEVVGVPVGIQQLAAPYPGPTPAASSDQAPGQTRDRVPEPDPGLIRRAADLLAAARRPVLLAGRGAIGARDDLIALAGRAGCLLATTWPAKGLFHGEPYDIGVCGGFALQAARRLILDADALLVCGASLNRYTTASGELTRGKVIIQVDHDAAAFGRHVRPDLAVPAEAAAAARLLRAALGAGREGYRGPAVAHAIDGMGTGEFTDESTEAGLDLRTVACALDRFLPAGRGFVADVGYHASEPAKFVAITAPRRQALTVHFGSIGLALATSVGLAASDPSAPVLCAVGDGGLAGAVGELDTLRRTGLPVAVAVFNDSAYAVEYHTLRGRGRSPELSLFQPVSFASVARAYGIEAMTASRLDDLPRVREFLDPVDRPKLVDFKIRPDVVTRWYADVTSAPAVRGSAA